jgi:hypothetical protein
MGKIDTRLSHSLLTRAFFLLFQYASAKKAINNTA